MIKISKGHLYSNQDHIMRFEMREENQIIEKIFKKAIDIKTELQGTPEYSNPMIWRKKLLSHGISSLDLPKSLGGQGLSCKEMTRMFEFFGRIDMNLRDVPGSGHARLILNAKTSKFNHILKEIIEKGNITAIGVTEENAGSIIRNMETTATKIGDTYKITGKKKFISRVKQADYLILFAKIKRKKVSKKLTAFLVPTKLVKIIEERDPIGLNGVSWTDIELDNVSIPIENRIGREGDGSHLFQQHMLYWRLSMSSSAIGNANRAIELLKIDLEQRKLLKKKRYDMESTIKKLKHIEKKIKSEYNSIEKNMSKLDNTNEKTIESYRKVAGVKAQTHKICSKAIVLAKEKISAIGIDKKYGLSDISDCNDCFGKIDGATEVMDKFSKNTL